MNAGLRELLRALSERDHIPSGPQSDAIESGFHAVFSGTASPVQIAAFIMALKLRPLTADLLVAGARALRTNGHSITAPAGAVDTCGTGGDGLSTLNISTAAAIVAAGAGAVIAKHGGRAVSSKAGSAETLAALGVNPAMDAPTAIRALAEAGFGFFFAAHWRTGMAHVAPVRAELGFRSIFNLLGPLANPAGVERQVLGVWREDLVAPMAEALRRLGVAHALVVHGADGLDEISISGPTFFAEIRGDAIHHYVRGPADWGIARARLADLAGGDPAFNAAAITRLLDGARSPFRDAAIVNAGAALMVAGRAASIAEGASQAAAALDEGRARRALAALVRISHESDGERPA